MSDKNYAEDELLALSGIQHFSFCKRQWALIHIEQQWDDNLRTVQGHFLHERADDPFFSESRGEVFISRSIPLVSHSLGLYGIADVVEYIQSRSGICIPGHEGLWIMHPVEYKRGKPKPDKRDEVQLCAQVMCLEEMFDVTIYEADFYYYAVRRRLHLSIDDELRDHVRSLSDEMHELYRKGVTPPADKTRNCKYCSLVDICVPKITKKRRAVKNYIAGHVEDACVSERSFGPEGS